MRRPEQQRRQWQALVARFEPAGTSQAAFAAAAGVGLPALRYWLYKLRGEKAPARSPGREVGSTEVRLLPVEVRQAAGEEDASIEVDVARVRLRVRGEVDPAYVAALVGALPESGR